MQRLPCPTGVSSGIKDVGIQKRREQAWGFVSISVPGSTSSNICFALLRITVRSRTKYPTGEQLM